MNNLSALCDDDTLEELMHLPEGIEMIHQVERETQMTDWGPAFSGRAHVAISVQNKEEQDLMKEWSYQRSFENVAHWNDDPVYMSIPALHTCNLCYSEGKKFKGHDTAWCRIYRPPKNPKGNEIEKDKSEHVSQNIASNELNPQMPDTENNSDISQPPLKDIATPQQTLPTETVPTVPDAHLRMTHAKQLTTKTTNLCYTKTGTHYFIVITRRRRSPTNVVVDKQTQDSSSTSNPKMKNEQIITACNLNDYKISDLRHQTERLSTEFETHNGICYAEVDVQDQTQLELIQWNQENFLSKFSIDEISFKCQIQKLLQCDFCRKEKLQFMGHHVRQCKLRKDKPKPSEEEMSESPSDGEDELETQHGKPTEVDLETIYFFDTDAKKIMNAKEMDTIHKGIAERAHKKESVDIVNSKQVVVNQLRYVELVSEEIQKELFEKHKWKHRSNECEIQNFSAFALLRGKMDVFYDNKEKTIHLRNLQNNLRAELVTVTKQPSKK